MAKFRYGGANKIIIKTHNGSAFDSPAALTLTNVISTQPQRQDNGSYQITITQEEDTEALYTFLDTAIVAASSTTVAERTYEDGTKIGGGVSEDVPTYYIFVYGAEDGESTSKRPVFVARGYVSPSSGSWNQAAGEPTNPTFQFNTLQQSGALAILGTEFDSTLVRVSGFVNGQAYRITNRITTADSRVYERSTLVRCQER